MAKFNVVDMNGQHVSEIELSDAVFGITPNEKAVHIAVVNFLANQRQGTQNTKIRMEVSGGGKKPWRQKGTGHARQGSIRAPQWTHGRPPSGPPPPTPPPPTTKRPTPRTRGWLSRKGPRAWSLLTSSLAMSTRPRPWLQC